MLMTYVFCAAFDAFFNTGDRGTAAGVMQNNCLSIIKSFASQMTPDINSLRKFSLVVALILISYSVAGVQLEPGGKASVLGLPFLIQSPKLLAIGLALASCYGLLRFFYYGVMLSSTPHKSRMDILHKLHARGLAGTYSGSVYFGPSIYLTTPSIPDRKAVEEELGKILNAFPSVGMFRPAGSIEGYDGVDDGVYYQAFHAEVEIPLPCRLAALIQDADYILPIPLNIAALVVYFVS